MTATSAAARRAKERGEEWWLRCRQEARLAGGAGLRPGLRGGPSRRRSAPRSTGSALAKHGRARQLAGSHRAPGRLAAGRRRRRPPVVRRLHRRHAARATCTSCPTCSTVVDLALDGGVDAVTVRDRHRDRAGGHPAPRAGDVRPRRAAVGGRGQAGRGRSSVSAAVLDDPDPTLPRFRARAPPDPPRAGAAGHRRPGRPRGASSAERSTATWPAGRGGGGTGPAALLARLEGGCRGRKAS